MYFVPFYATVYIYILDPYKNIKLSSRGNERLSPEVNHFKIYLYSRDERVKFSDAFISRPYYFVNFLFSYFPSNPLFLFFSLLALLSIKNLLRELFISGFFFSRGYYLLFTSAKLYVQLFIVNFSRVLILYDHNLAGQPRVMIEQWSFKPYIHVHTHRYLPLCMCNICISAEVTIMHMVPFMLRKKCVMLPS